MKEKPDKKIVFFGCPLDCDEKHDAIQDKLYGTWNPDGSDDPLDNIMRFISHEVPQHLYRVLDSISVPSWLRPKPHSKDLPQVNTEAFISFIDSDGCKSVADKVQALVSGQILPDIPCMIGVDHSLTGGIYKALADYYGRDNLTLIVLDSHTDAIPMSVLADAIQYDLDTNSNSVHDRNDPFLYNRPDSYNASSFLYHMLSQGIINPENLYLLGVSDYPAKRAFRIKDPRIVRFVKTYARLKKSGTKIVTKKKCIMGSSMLNSLLKQIKTPYVYISIDMDIGALSAVEGVRFRNWKGLNEKQIYKMIDTLESMFSHGVKLAGMDITEIDTRRAGQVYPAGIDQTYRIAANLVKKIAFEKPL